MRPSLAGLIKWTNGPEWDDPVDFVFALHLAAIDEHDLDPDQLLERIGAPAFEMLQSFAFEDFLTSDPEHGRNPIDAYLTKRGWKETPTTRAYLAALRLSVPSVYEVSNVVPGELMLVRDLIRGGDPVRVEEKSATQSLHQWDVLAARVFPFRGKIVLGGGILPLHRQSADWLVAEFDRLREASRSERVSTAKARGIDLPDTVLHDAIDALDTIDVMLRASAFLLSTAWLLKTIDDTNPANRPKFRTREGDDVEPVALGFKFRPKVSQAQIREALKREPALYPAGRSMWSWVVEDTYPAADRDEDGLRLETWTDNGKLVLGNVELSGRTVQFTAMSRARADRGTEMLSRTLDSLVWPPIEIELDGSDAAGELDLGDEESRALVHGFLDTHYRKVLDEALPSLGGMTPRQAAASPATRHKAVEWLKFIENGTRSETSDASGYDFVWMWEELGLADQRR